jgi:hypothetical protein
MLDSGDVASRAELARRVGVSRARVTQVLGPGRDDEKQDLAVQSSSHCRSMLALPI